MFDTSTDAPQDRASLAIHPYAAQLRDPSLKRPARERLCETVVAGLVFTLARAASHCAARDEAYAPQDDITIGDAGHALDRR